MAIFLPPAPPVPRTREQQQTAYSNASFWSDWYEQLRNLVNQTISSIDWSIITGTPTTLAGYGITDAAPLSHVGAGGAAHADVVAAGASGFMTGADKTKLDAMTIASGTYTPTLTNVTNITATTAYQCQYMRVNSVVTVSGKIDIHQTGAGNFEVGVSLPIASNFGAEEDCAGHVRSVLAVDTGGYIKADAANNRASINGDDNDHTNHSHFFMFTYEII